MRRASFLFCLLAIAGCGAPKSKLAGKWHVDPTSIKVSRLQASAEQSADWTDATATLGKISVDFSSEPQVATATGFGMNSSASWKLRGNEIQIESKDEWPVMTFDPNGLRIHLTMERGNDRMQMDLIK